jgi:hypothetical protein
MQRVMVLAALAATFFAGDLAAAREVSLPLRFDNTLVRRALAGSGVPRVEESVIRHAEMTAAQFLWHTRIG